VCWDVFDNITISHISHCGKYVCAHLFVFVCEFVCVLILLSAQNDHPIFNLVSSHLLACVAFVPIVIGLFFFMFAVFDDDYVIAFFFMVNLWLTETFTLIFVRTRPSTSFYGGFVGTYLFIFYGM
jgi:hypothetical protein